MRPNCGPHEVGRRPRRAPRRPLESSNGRHHGPTLAYRVDSFTGEPAAAQLRQMMTTHLCVMTFFGMRGVLLTYGVTLGRTRATSSSEYNPRNKTRTPLVRVRVRVRVRECVCWGGGGGVSVRGGGQGRGLAAAGGLGRFFLFEDFV